MRKRATQSEAKTVKTTVILPESLHRRARMIAAFERKDFRDVVIDALEAHVQARGKGWLDKLPEAPERG